ncbi:ribonuclease H family protein, partial [Streptococcus pseudopneumoniae]
NKEQKDFDTLKQKLTSQPVLKLPDLSKPFEVQCDACGECLGAFLLQEGHAITYESR